MTDTSTSIDAVAKRLGLGAWPSHDVAARLRGAQIVCDGYGSIARPASELLAARGARRFLLIDPKRYRAASADSQCEPDEVGCLKVDVGAERLRALGAEVTTYKRDLFAVPEGVIDRRSIVITSVDNRRADIGSNRRAARIGARVLKVNVEPAYDVAAVRAYDFRRETTLCVECQFAEHHYLAQRHPKSCDGAGDGRRTNSPRWLSQAAASMAAIATMDLACDESAAARWFGRQWQYFPQTGLVSTSRLTPKAVCRWDHARRWQDPVTLGAEEGSISLGELFKRSGVAPEPDAAVRFCQRVALAGSCADCHRKARLVRWVADETAMARCESCGGRVHADAFWSFEELPLELLLAVFDRPLGDWGVEGGAVIELAGRERRQAFVVHPSTKESRP